jgi:hypothetical protein
MKRGWGSDGNWMVARALAGALTASLFFVEVSHAEPRAYESREEMPPAAPEEKQPATTSGQPGAVPSTAAPAKPKHATKREAYPPAIEPRRGGSNYFTVGLYDSTDKDAHLVKFQVDLEYDVMRLEHWPKVGAFYLTAPIQFLSFWDLFDTLDGAVSSPFVETDYAVGGEVAWVAPWQRFWMLRAGMLHQSNGLGFLAGSERNLLQSRSWNRIYLETIHEALSLDWVRIEVAWAGWIPFASDEVVQWDNGERGGKIQDHVGYWEVRPTVVFPLGGWPDIIASARIREHSVNAELRYSLKGEQLVSATDNFFRLDIIGQCFYGRAERLITANETKWACYLGLGM